MGQGPAPGMGTRVRFPSLGDLGGLWVISTEVPQRRAAQVAALGRALWARQTAKYLGKGGDAVGVIMLRRAGVFGRRTRPGHAANVW